LGKSHGVPANPRPVLLAALDVAPRRALGDAIARWRSYAGAMGRVIEAR